jgi:hypothetical protein
MGQLDLRMSMLSPIIFFLHTSPEPPPPPQDALEGESNQSMSSLGVRSGDLLWLLTPQVPGLPSAALQGAPPQRSTAAHPAAPTPEVETPSKLRHHAAAADDDAVTVPIDAGGSGTAQNSDGAAVAEASDGGGDAHPLLSALPAHWLRALAGNPSLAETPIGAAVLAAHAAMLETGFQPTWASTNSSGNSASADAHIIIPNSSCIIPGLLKMGYRLRSADADADETACCEVQCSTMQGSLLVAACTPKGHLRHVTLATGSYFLSNQPSSEDAHIHGEAAGCATPAAADEVNAGAAVAIAGRWRLPPDAFRSLWTELKDGIAFPMLLATHADAGLSPPAGLLALPEEIKRLLLGLLGPEDLAALACVSAELRHLASADDLWARLVAVHFPTGHEGMKGLARHRGHKWVFGRLWRDRREREAAARRLRRRFLPSAPRMGHVTPPFYPPIMPGHPGIAGGDYDRLPPPFGGGMFGGGGGAFFLGGSGVGRSRGGFRLH